MLLKAALKYLEMGYSVIPCRQDKKPHIKWEFYQKRLPTESEVRSWWSKWPDANVGLVTGKVSGLCVFDQDDDKAIEYFDSLLPESMLMPMTSTPRDGRHCYFKCPDDAPTNKAMINGYKLDFRGEGGYILAPPSRNGNGKGYKFLPHANIKSLEIPQLPDSLLVLLKNNSISIKEGVASLPETMFLEGRRDQDIFHIAHVMLKGGAKKDEARQVLEILAKNCNPPFPENEISVKIQSALSRRIRGENGLTEEIKRVIESQNGVFSVAECVNWWHEGQNEASVSNSVRGQIRKILSRLAEPPTPLIKRVGEKAGYYRRVESTCPDMDLEVDPGEGHPVELPFNLRKWVKLYPKNIVVVGGSKSSGKTAFLMNTAFMNKDFKDGVYYYNSEGGAEEVRGRLDLFPYPFSDWKKVHFKSRNFGFADIIQENPNAIHIIDFLELHDDFFKVGGIIREIYDALDKGVAIIGIQKPAGRDEPIGKDRALEKARLILALDRGKIKIFDAKNFATKGVNPRGWTLQYKIVDGCRYFVEPDAETGEDWREERDETNRPPRT